MTDESVQVVNKPAFLEVSDGKVLIPIMQQNSNRTFSSLTSVTKDSYYGASTFE